MPDVPVHKMTVILGEFSMEYKVCSLVRMMNEVFTLFFRPTCLR